MVALRLQGLAKVPDPERFLLRIELSQLFIFTIFFLSGIFSYFWLCIHYQQRYLQGVAHRLNGKFERTTSLLEQIVKARGFYQFVGQHLQRPLTIRYFYRWNRLRDVVPGHAPDEWLEVQFALIQKFWLRMILDPDHGSEVEEETLGIPELDSLYVIHTNQPAAAREFLSNQPALQDLRRLPFPFHRLEIHKGWGKAEFHFPARRRFGSIHVELAVGALARLFGEYEKRSTLVIVAQASPETRCPYCREPLGSALQQTVQCLQCGVRLHQICWNENKQCTTWGCESTVAVQVNRQDTLQ